VSKLLINEYPLQVLPRLAVAIGLNEAIVVQQIHYWLERSSIEKNGYKWVYNTVQQWQEQFPFWSADTVRRTLAALKESRLLVGERLADNAFDKTLYYRIDYDVLATIEGGILPSSDSGNLPSSGNAKRNRPLYRTETTTETTTEKGASALPEWMDPQLWRDWQEHRKAIKKKMTPQAEKLALKQLGEFHAAGHNLQTIIERSIAGGWTSFYLRQSDPMVGSAKHPKSLNDMDYSADLF
jgi:hypothetical protein